MGGASGIGGALAGEVIGAGLKVLKNTRVVSKAINTMQDMASRGKNAIKSGFAKFAKKNGKVVEVDTEFRQTFYQVTSKEDAKTIMKDNVLIRKEFKEVYAWKAQPTLKQVSDSGARSMETVISFEIHPNVFTRDPHIHKSLENIAMISVRPAPIAVSNVKEVGFKKEWWKFWKQ